jgi:type IV secretory pathway VirB4 component
VSIEVPVKSGLAYQLRRPGLRLPRHRATTAHAQALYPWHIDSGLGSRGIYIGEDITGGNGAWCFDPFQLYTDKVLTSPNMLVLGVVGSGKSSAVKTYLYRSVGLLRSGADTDATRWAGILDPKGEYGPLADALGLTRLELYPGGPTRLNPLDPGPYTESVDQLRMRRAQMIGALAAALLHRELTPTEDAAVGWVVGTITTDTTARPTLHDVVGLLADPSDDMVAKSASGSSERLSRELADLRFGLTKLLSGPLMGMFDGPTTGGIGWEGRGVVVDLKHVHSDHELLTVVMVAAMGWFQSLLTAKNSGVKRVQVWEEIWALLGQERTAKWFQQCQKLSRDYGVANISVAHRIADLRSQSDDGSAAAKVATGLLADTQTRVLFRQSEDQIADAVNMLGLTATEAAILPKLARGRALWQLPGMNAVVQHRIGSGEWPITETDAGLSI